MTATFVRLLKDGHPENGLGLSDMVSKEAFTSSDTTELIHEFHASADGELSSGVWECAPCKEEIPAYPCNEMMHVLAGSVTLTAPDGSSETFTPGDTFFIPKGAPCTWEITETLRKFYMIAP